MESCRGELLAQQISKYAPLSIHEALAVSKRVFLDGPASRDEADALFDASSLFGDTDCAWKCAFVEVITGHLLGQETEYGVLEFDAEDWLIEMANTEDMLGNALRFELLQSVLLHAKNASTRLARFALACTMRCDDKIRFEQNNKTARQAS